MREILFRGKRVDNGEWVAGYYVISPLNQHRIYWQPFKEATSNTYHEVIAESIGQYCLTNNSGIKIFEGDKVKKPERKNMMGKLVRKEFTGVVVFNDLMFEIDCGIGDWLPLEAIDEVIGTIHD